MKKKVLPTPGSLSSQMRPPISSTSRRAIVESQAGAAVLARGGHVGLREGLEQFRRLLLGHADAGVQHGELQLHFFPGAFQQFDLQPDFAVAR